MGIGTDPVEQTYSSRHRAATEADQTQFISSIRADDVRVNIGGVNNTGAIQVTGAGTASTLLLNPFAGNVGINTTAQLHH